MVWTVSIYNSLTKKKEFFKPMVEGQVSLYVTGFTSYDYSHMGHGRAYIIKRADERECDPLELSAEFCQEFLMDMADLQCLPHTVQPCISDHMDQIKNMIAKPDAIVTTPTDTIRPPQPAILSLDSANGKAHGEFRRMKRKCATIEQEDTINSESMARKAARYYIMIQYDINTAHG
ncbi:cysteine--tRNA ligase 2, cytoplasmic [Tanacetum coccineum]